MKCISDSEIRALSISPKQCVSWVKEAFLLKSECQLPPKISVHPQGNDFFTSMPCLLPSYVNRFGCKVVSRIKGMHPSLKSDLMLFDSSNGELLSLMNCDWITTMRTGAVAALAIDTLQNSDATVYSFIGLGHTARATMKCLIETVFISDIVGNRNIKVKLYRYKNQAERFIEEFAESIPSVSFYIVDTIEELIEGADVLISCITDANGLLCDDTSLYKKGVLVVPVHTRGFQNLDTEFDKIFADDTGHVKGFQNFTKFKRFAEISSVLKGDEIGRSFKNERILSYNIGLGLHDVYFATKIFEMLEIHDDVVSKEMLTGGGGKSLMLSDVSHGISYTLTSNYNSSLRKLSA